MNIELWEDRIISYLEGDLSKEASRELFKAIAQDESLDQLYQDYVQMYLDLGDMPVEIPERKVKQNFETWLAQVDPTEVQSNAKIKYLRNWKNWASIAAVLVFVLGFWQVYQTKEHTSRELANLNDKLNSLMTDQSSTERIKAIRVNYNSYNQNVDELMFQELVEILNTDRSSNVRLAAVETLTNYLDNEYVRTALIKSLDTESDGAVKLAIIYGLGQRKNDEIKSTLEKIVNDDSHEKFVIDEAHMQLIRFEKIDI